MRKSTGCLEFEPPNDLSADLDVILRNLLSEFWEAAPFFIPDAKSVEVLLAWRVPLVSFISLRVGLPK